MKKVSLIISFLFLSGCGFHDNEISNLSKQGYPPRQIVDILNSKNITEAEVYSLASDRSSDVRYISETDLNHVASLVSCMEPPGIIYQVVINPSREESVEPTRFIDSYKAKAFITADNKVKVVINRPNCKIDLPAINEYLPLAINNNKRKEDERIRREEDFEQRNPRKVFLMGCNAYIDAYKDNDYADINNAVKKYPKLKEAYVRRLYTQGWKVAESGLASNKSSCEYRSYTSLVVQ